MKQYTDIHSFDVRDLSLQSFTQLLLNDYYPFFYTEINRLGDLISRMKTDFDMDMLDIIQQTIYKEFDEMYRKEKLVLFPYIIKLEEEERKSENCKPFKNTKTHYTSVMNLISEADKMFSDLFINALNEEAIQDAQKILSNLRKELNEIQFIKEHSYYRKLKNCSGCKTI